MRYGGTPRALRICTTVWMLLCTCWSRMMASWSPTSTGMADMWPSVVLAVASTGLPKIFARLPSSSS
jgi:hypothetical protein